MTREPFTLIDRAFVDSLLLIHKRLEGSGVIWSIGGDLGEVLRGVKLEADAIEILTNEKEPERSPKR